MSLKRKTHVNYNIAAMQHEAVYGLELICQMAPELPSSKFKDASPAVP